MASDYIIDKFPNGLREVLDETRMSQAELARRIGKQRQEVKRWYDGAYRLTPEIAEQIAQHLPRTAEQLLFPHRSAETVVPLLSWISAGGLAEPRAVAAHDEALEMIRWSLNEKGDWFALRVEGDSMNRISPPDSVIFVNRRDKRLVGNACYIIADADGNASYKRYRTDPARWEPVSTNEAHEPSYVEHDGEPVIIGRVRRTLLSM